MPYIKPERRLLYDFPVNDLVQSLLDSQCVRGDVNYVLTRVVLGALKPKTGWSYHSLSDCVSVLRDAADEIQRRLLGPYEDTAAERNGDVWEFDGGSK